MTAKKTEHNESQEQNPFALSTGDMMSVLMFVFVLLLLAMMLQYKTETAKTLDDAQKREKQISDYQDLKTTIREKIELSLGDSLRKWNAVIDENLTIVFDEKISFDPGRDNLIPEFKRKMDYFFPHYLEVIMKNDTIKGSIEEIRIEGHTDSTRIRFCSDMEAPLNSNSNYLCNMGLSQRRSLNVLRYGLDSTQIDELTQEFLKDKIVATGFSFSHPRKDGTNHKRVEFRIRTNAEQKMKEILDSLKTLK